MRISSGGGFPPHRPLTAESRLCSLALRAQLLSYQNILKIDNLIGFDKIIKLQVRAAMLAKGMMLFQHSPDIVALIQNIVAEKTKDFKENGNAALEGNV